MNNTEIFTQTIIGSLTPLIIYVISGILFITCLILLYKIEIKKWSKEFRYQLCYYTLKILGFLILTLAGLLFYITIMIHITAYPKGFTEWTTTSMTDIIGSYDSTPTEDILPNDLTDCIIIYYRYGCSDCELLYISQTIPDTTRVYWVSSRTTQGKNLRESLPITNVPTGIYINTNGNPTYYDLVIDGEVNIDNVNALLSNIQ